MKLTYEELEARCERLEELLKKALNRIAELEERLNQNSGDSSRPPSSDYKSNTRKRPSKKRLPRDGFARALVPIEQVDSHQFCELDACPCCGSDALFERSEPTTLQQVELPEARGIVTQYDLRNYGGKSCGSNVQASLPLGVPNSAFGPRLMALMGSLTGVFHLSKDGSSVTYGSVRAWRGGSSAPLDQNFQEGNPSNNLAERDLPRVVLWRKKSYGTRSDRGQRFVETITSVANTVRRIGENILDFVTSAVIRHYQGLDAPLIRACEGF